MHTEGLSLRYQPIVSATTGRLVAVEALLRDETSPQAAPRALLADAAHGGYAERLDRTVTEWACAQLTHWRANGLHVPIHVNISAATALSKDVDRFTAWLARLPVRRGERTLEITETTRIRGISGIVAFVEKCREAGCEVAIDDFGCGYSTLALLQRFRADIVKIDKRFVKPLRADAWTRSIVRHMIALAHDLGMRVVGEGIETEEQMEWLRLLDCDELQGYAIARPMTGSDLFQWARTTMPPDYAVGM